MSSMLSRGNADLESVLTQVGLGPYQVKLTVFLGFACVTNAWYATNYVFAAQDVLYRCKYSECKEFSYSNISSNMSENGSGCSYSTGKDDNETGVVKCDEWIYEDPTSFVAEFDLGGEDWKRTLVGTVHSVGYMFGLLVVGPLSDKFGRKKIIVGYGIIGAIMGLARSVTNCYGIYLALEFIEAFVGDPFSPTFTLGIEMVAKEKRGYAVCAVPLFGALGGTILALIAWTVPYWRHYLRIIYAPSLLFVFYLFIIDESPRWLLSKGMKGDAIVIIKKAAKTNSVNIDDISLEGIKCEEDSASSCLVDLLKITFTSKKLMLRFLACIAMWATTSFNFYSMLINSVSLEGNKYINYGITALCSVPSSLCMGFLLYRCNRKITVMLSLALTGTIFVVQSLIPKHYQWTAAGLFYAGKLNSSIAFTSVYLYTSELFPTYLRNTMHAMCSSMGRIGSMLAPQTPLLAKYWSGIPSIIVGVLSLVTTAVIMLMPDTAEDILPDTVRQAEAIGCKGQPNSNDMLLCSRL